MKIALITRRFPPLIGGAEKVLSYLAPAFASEGAEVTVLTAQPPGLKLPGLVTDHPPKGNGRLTIVRLPTSRLRFVGTWLYMRNLKRWLMRNDVDIAYVSMLKHDSYVAVDVGRRRGFPVILRPEGAGATGDLAWQLWGRFGRQIGVRCKQADAIISISTAITEELHKDGYDPSKIQTIPNGVPIPEPSWQRRPDWRAKPTAVYVGRLAPEKGLDTLITAWPKVVAQFPSAQLILVGEGPERKTLESLVTQLGMNPFISLTGAVENPQNTLRETDLFVFPSREEGMSIALLEAMALGIPLVATSIPGNRRLIQDCTHGRLVAPNEPESLAQGIIAQWSNFDRAFHMTRAARRRVQHEFSITAVAKRHIELFQTLLEKKGDRTLPRKSDGSC